MATLTTHSKTIFNYVRDNKDVDFTTADIAEATGLPKRTVDGCVTALQHRYDLVERVEAEEETEDGKHKTIKLVKLTAKGETFDPEAGDDDAE
jgi:hypothetical protein